MPCHVDVAPSLILKYIVCRLLTDHTEAQLVYTVEHWLIPDSSQSC